MIEKSTMPVPISAGVEELFKEIQDIYGQYKREVPRKRGPWPAAIQSRVLELWKLGVTTHQISVGTGLACQTMYSWKQRLKKQVPDGFLPVPIVRKRRRSHGESHNGALSPLKNATAPTLTVIIDEGIRLEGVPVDQVAKIIREIKGS